MTRFLVTTAAVILGTLAALWTGDAFAALGAGRWIVALWVGTGVTLALWLGWYVWTKGRGG